MRTRPVLNRRAVKAGVARSRSLHGTAKLGSSSPLFIFCQVAPSITGLCFVASSPNSFTSQISPSASSSPSCDFLCALQNSLYPFYCAFKRLGVPCLTKTSPTSPSDEIAGFQRSQLPFGSINHRDRLHCTAKIIRALALCYLWATTAPGNIS